MSQSEERIYLSEPTNEEELERRVISLFRAQGYLYSSGDEVKKDYSEVFLVDDLATFLKPRYPDLDCIHIDIWNILDDLNNDDKNFHDFNRAFFRKLNDGIVFKRERDQKVFSIQLIDFNSPENNVFRVVNQLAVEGNKKRRVDLAVYVNGIPLVIWELKSPSVIETDLRHAHRQLKKYEKEIPNLFKYNAFSVICDGLIRVKYGVTWEKFEDFKEWKKISDEIDSKGKDLLSITIEGLFNKQRFIQVIENFIWFSDNNSEKKIICRYPQFYGALKLLRNIEKEVKPKGSGKGGIYWGATGCGKSLTMLFLSRLLIKTKTLNKPTIVLITDRVEIEKQLCELFQNSKEFLRDKTVEEIESRKDLQKELKNLKVGGVFLTNIQKFSADREPLSDRNNIICISDEAHRSQHNLDVEEKIEGDEVKEAVPFAKRLHESFPNAVYVGFTATPRDKTMAVFGEIVDSYTTEDSINDGFTVRIVCDSRKSWINLIKDNADIAKRLYDELEQRGTEKEVLEEDQKMRTRLQAVCGISERIEMIAKDIVEYYERRTSDLGDDGRMEGSEVKSVKGKAFIVTNGRRIGYEFYKKIRELRPKWFEKDQDGFAKVHLVMTRDEKKEGKDDREMYDSIGNDEWQKKLDKAFKDDDSSFKIAIVSDKWLTGFNCPSLDTMFLDRVFTGNQLIQTVSRVNRKFLRKHYGLIVNYWPIQRAFIKANRELWGAKKAFLQLEDVITKTRDKLEVLNKLFSDFDRDWFWREKIQSTQERIVRKYREKKGEKFSRDFREKYLSFMDSYDCCSSSEKVDDELRSEKSFYKLIYKYWMSDIHRKRELIPEQEKKKLDKYMREMFEVPQEIEQKSFGTLTLNFPSEDTLLDKNQSKDEKHRKAMQYLEEAKKVYENFGERFIKRLEWLKKQWDDAWENQERLDELEREEKIRKIEEEYNELIQEAYEKLNEHKKRGWSLGEDAIYEILIRQKEEHKLEISEQKLIDLTREIFKLHNRIKSLTDWETRRSITDKLKAELCEKLDSYHFCDESENYDEIIENSLKQLISCLKRMNNE